jgi:hypothetical protein
MNRRRAVIALLAGLVVAGCAGKSAPPAISLRDALERGDVDQVRRNFRSHKSGPMRFGGVNDPLDKTGEQPIHVAAKLGHLQLLRLLLDEGAEINSPGLWGYRNTALHLAAAGGHTAIVRELLSRGARTYSKDAAGRLPLDVARAAGHTEIAALLAPRVLRLVTATCEVTLVHDCEEGCVTCDDMVYYGRSRKSGHEIMLRGGSMHHTTPDGTPGGFWGYRFENGDTTYLIWQTMYPNPTLQVIRGEAEVLVEEQGQWLE